jgi:hypothetical protein
MEVLEDRLAPSATPLVAVSYFDSAVYEFNASTGALLKTLVAPYSQSVLSGASGLTVGPDGNLYLSSQLKNSIVEYNFKTHTLSTFISSSVLAKIAAANGDSVFAPAGLRFGPGGSNLYVSLNGGRSATSGGAVVRFSINNQSGALTFGGSATTIATGLIQPTEMTFGLAPSDQTSLYVSNSGGDSVVKIADPWTPKPAVTTFLAPGSGGLSYPTGLAWGPDGKLYVVDLGAVSDAGQVLRYNADGTFDEVFTRPPTSLQFQFPSDALFAPGGDLLTANLGPAYPPALQGSISEFDPSGSFLKTFVSSSQFPNTGPGKSGISPSQLTFLAPMVSINGSATVAQGQPYTLQLSDQALPGHKITSWTIQWGDGATTVVAGELGSVQHTYFTGPNNYTITAGATDGIGVYSAVNALTVAVVDPVITVQDIKDVEIIQNADGSQLQSFGLFVGNNVSGTHYRDLIQFDLHQIPAHSIITNVQLSLGLFGGVSKFNSPNPVLIGVHRVLSPWQGTGEHSASWLHSSYPMTRWHTRGGDFVLQPSSVLAVGKVNPFNPVPLLETWPSTTALVNDVQGWVNNPSSNLGWLLQGDESQPFTVRAFFQHGNMSSDAIPPTLTVTYQPPPVH